MGFDPLYLAHFWGAFLIVKVKKKIPSKKSEKILKIKKNFLRTMVKTPAQTDEWLKSYGQKTAQKSPGGPRGDFWAVFYP